MLNGPIDARKGPLFPEQNQHLEDARAVHPAGHRDAQRMDQLARPEVELRGHRADRFLERDPSRSRGVRILGMDLNPDAVSIPCFRDLPDGRGSRPDRAESFLTLDRKLISTRGSFAVRAKGDGLSVLGVSEGDYLLVEPTSIDQVEDGAVLVVRDGEGANYQRITRNGRGVYLHDLRSGFDPLLIEDPSKVELVGRVSALIHRMDGRGPDVSLTTH